MNHRTVQILTLGLLGALVAWGSYTLFYYVGTPLHSAVLLTDDVLRSLQLPCAEGGAFCQGLFGFVQFVRYTFVRAAPFLPYGIVSLVAYGAFVAWQVAKAGSGTFRLLLRPWQFAAFFLASLWLLFVVLAHSSHDQIPMRRIVEPRPDIYRDINEQTYAALERNFNELRDAGCLALVDTNLDGIKFYDVRESCVQGSFVTRVLLQVIVAAAFLFELLVAGHALLGLAGFRPRRVLLEGMLSVGAGTLAWIAILWLLAISSAFVPVAGWALVLLTPLLCYRSSLYWLRVFFTHRWEVELRWRSIGILLAWLLVTYLAMNFLTVIRPFPIGWDDLGSYLNRPRQLVSYGSFIHSMATFQWEYLTALGFLLFGFGSYVGATASMVINWTEGLLAVLAIILFSREFLGRGRGMLAALLYYTLPLVGHFSFADMKIDNAVFLMGTLAVLAVFEYLFEVSVEGEGGETGQRREIGQGAVGVGAAPQRDRRWLVLGGLFIALAFGMKLTAVMTLLALLVVLAGGFFGWAALLGLSVLLLAFLMQQNLVNVTTIVQRMFGPDVQASSALVAGLLAIVGLVPLGWSLIRGRAIARRAAIAFGIFAVSAGVGIAPWNIYNNALIGRVLPSLQTGAPNRISPTISLGQRDPAQPLDPAHDVRFLPPELVLNDEHPFCTPTGAREELDRYWGFGTGIGHYLTLPWRTAMNIDSGGYYVTTAPILLLFPLLLLLPYFWSREGRWLRFLFAATALILVQWMFVANGVPWYGLGVFLGIVVGIEALVARAPDGITRAVAGTLVGFSLLTSYGFRLWQFEQQRNLVEYPMGKISAAALEQRTIPWYGPISQVVVDRHATVPGRPYMYRVGTFIPYFIPRNFEMIGVTDHQLDFFNCMNQERDHAKTLARLRALGFNSIIFDTNTATIEKDEHGSLHQKVQSFVNFLNDSAIGLQVVVNDEGAGVAFILIP